MLIFENKIINVIEYKMNSIKEKIYTKIRDLQIEGFLTKEPLKFDNRTEGVKQKFEVGKAWGELWDCAWINVRSFEPIKDFTNLVMLFDCGGEALIFDRSGQPIRGLTNVSSEFELSLGLPGKKVFQIDETVLNDGYLDIWIDIACNDLFGSSKGGVLEQAELAVCSQQLRALYYDIWVLLDFIKCADKKTPRCKSAFYALKSAVENLTDLSDEKISNAREILSVELRKKGGDSSLNVVGIGHAHIDLAWLWPIRETKRKGGRTFSTVIDLMNRYPDYHFGASQPQLFKWVKEDYPQLYDKIKERVKEGRFEIQGDMWVEADMNVPSGESLVRQFLYGKKFYKKEFGMITRMLWLPDVFGYNGNIPQIMKKSDVDYFMTQKLSWSEHNKFPHHTFMWEGIDGSKVLAHMLPEDTYNGPAAPRSIKKIEESYLEGGICDEALMLFGIGDGGGGPGPEHLERLDRIKDFNGISPVTQGKAVDFFNRIDKNKDKYPVYKGELYLEKHQGTLTTQANNKYYNRKLEIALKDLEYFSSLAMLYKNIDYPAKKIQEFWEEILLYQFHDILPGSSIKRVYDESVERYKFIENETNKMINDLLVLFSKTSGTDNDFMVFNTTSFERNEIITKNGFTRLVNLKPMSQKIVSFNESDKFEPMIAESQKLENSLIKVIFDKDGSITSIFDKEANREILKSGEKANQLNVYEDICGNCWDIDIYYRNSIPDTFILQNIEPCLEPGSAAINMKYSYGSSTLRQKVSIKPNSKLITFETIVDWNENLKMLRTSFPTNIFTDKVMCDIQFGKISRNSTQNSTNDIAQFEICAHKWIDYSQHDYGVALINDSKYGHYTKDGILDLNLLRSQNYPGKNSDRGTHKFTYALFPHSGDENVGKVNKEAYLLNNPIFIQLATFSTDEKDIDELFISSDNDLICIETVKKSEKGNYLVVRVHEFGGLNIKTKLLVNKKINNIYESNLMENNFQKVDFNDNQLELCFSPFEIKTLVLEC